MLTRPLSVTLIAWLFVAIGVGTAVGGLFPIASAGGQGAGEFQERLAELTPMVLSALVAVAGGVWMLRGRDLGRWLAAIWMGAHIVLSMLHSLSRTVVHALLFALIAFALFRPAASAYFRGARR